MMKRRLFPWVVFLCFSGLSLAAEFVPPPGDPPAPKEVSLLLTIHTLIPHPGSPVLERGEVMKEYLTLPVERIYLRDTDNNNRVVFDYWRANCHKFLSFPISLQTVPFPYELGLEFHYDRLERIFDYVWYSYGPDGNFSQSTMRVEESGLHGMGINFHHKEQLEPPPLSDPRQIFHLDMAITEVKFIY